MSRKRRNQVMRKLRTSSSSPPREVSKARLRSMTRGRIKINAFIQRGINLTGKKPPTVANRITSAVRNVIFNNPFTNRKEERNNVKEKIKKYTNARV